MTNKEGAPAAATAEAKSTGEQGYQAMNPCPCIVPQEATQVKKYSPVAQLILPLLGSGQRNARKKPELMAATGLSDRAFRRGVESLRRAGIVVCSGDYGYFLPATLNEVQGYIRQEDARAHSTFYTLRSARQLEAQMQAQGEQMIFTEMG